MFSTVAFAFYLLDCSLGLPLLEVMILEELTNSWKFQEWNQWILSHFGILNHTTILKCLGHFFFFLEWYSSCLYTANMWIKDLTGFLPSVLFGQRKITYSWHYTFIMKVKIKHLICLLGNTCLKNPADRFF